MPRSWILSSLSALMVSLPFSMACSAGVSNVSLGDEAVEAIAAGRKTVTEYADNETEAVAKAEKANPGWKAISAKKVNKDPKSRAWQVTLEK